MAPWAELRRPNQGARGRRDDRRQYAGQPERRRPPERAGRARGRRPEAGSPRLSRRWRRRTARPRGGWRAKLDNDELHVPKARRSWRRAPAGGAARPYGRRGNAGVAGAGGRPPGRKCCVRAPAPFRRTAVDLCHASSDRARPEAGVKQTEGPRRAGGRMPRRDCARSPAASAGGVGGAATHELDLVVAVALPQSSGASEDHEPKARRHRRSERRNGERSELGQSALFSTCRAQRGRLAGGRQGRPEARGCGAAAECAVSGAQHRCWWG